MEIYNKPDFKYREESFSILMVNAWELLLKAKIVKDNNDSCESIYVEKKKKDQTPSSKYKETRSGNSMTIDVSAAMNMLNLPKRMKEILELLIEIRDNSI
ncbi:MAG: DUF3644 domain-containing protein, partial [Flavobacteriales bacterium]